MHAFLHFVGSIVIIPYFALALFFILVGTAASSKGMVALLGTVLNEMYWVFGWGIYVVPVLWVCLVATGFLPSFQRAGSLGLCLLAVACFLVIVCLSSTRLGPGEIIFLIPCVVVAATSAWLFFRTVATE